MVIYLEESAKNFNNAETRFDGIWSLIIRRCSETLLVGAFPLKEKSPTITVGSFFSFSADNLTLNGPLFLQFLQSYNFSISYNS